MIIFAKPHLTCDRRPDAPPADLAYPIDSLGVYAAMQAPVRGIAEELVRWTAGRGRADLVADFAFPLPITVFCELVGVPIADRDAFPAWTGAMIAPPTPNSLMAAPPEQRRGISLKPHLI